MSNLKNLVFSKISDRLSGNAVLADEKCRQADQCIIKARKSGGRDKELIKEALKLYEESLDLFSKQAQPYIGIAYISYSAGNVEYAIGLLNKAKEIEPSNSQVKEMLEVFNDEFKQKNISNAISKVAGKSLSEKIGDNKIKIEINIFEKITSIFSKSTKRNKIDTVVPVSRNTVGNTSKASVTVVSKNSGNFFENLKNTSLNKK